MAQKPSVTSPGAGADDAQDEILRRYSATVGVTRNVERDIVEFLSSKYTANATLSLQEIADLYKCPLDRARRVVAALEKDKLLVPVGQSTYKVNI